MLKGGVGRAGLGLPSSRSLGVASTAIWTPENIDTTVWLDSSSNSNFSLTGTSVNTWYDLSGNDLHAILGGGTVTLTSENGVSFSNSFLRINSRPELNGDVFSWFIDFTPVYGTTSEAVLQTRHTTPTWDLWGTYVHNSPLMYGSYARTEGEGIWTGVNNIISNPTPTIISTVWALDDSVSTWIDGEHKSTVAGANKLPGTHQVTMIGKHVNGTNYPYYGKISEIIIIADEVDESTRLRVEGYLSHKRSRDLIEGHPYKYKPP
jgi:hypothetical protein